MILLIHRKRCIFYMQVYDQLVQNIFTEKAVYVQGWHAGAVGLGATLASFKSKYTSCYQQEHAGSKTLLQQNPPVINFGCQLIQMVLYNSHKTLIVVVRIHHDTLFTARRIASAVLATAILFVGPSVRLSYAGILSKRRHVARCSLHFRIAICV